MIWKSPDYGVGEKIAPRTQLFDVFTSIARMLRKLKRRGTGGRDGDREASQAVSAVHRDRCGGGVSPSTVDRVLNERGSASKKARQKVIAAAQKLGVPRILPSAAHELVHIDVLLPDNTTPFFLRLRGAITSACAILDKQIVVHRRTVDGADETSLLKAILKPPYRRQGLIIAAPDTRAVRQALREVLDRSESVVTVASNVADVQGIAILRHRQLPRRPHRGACHGALRSSSRPRHVFERTERLGRTPAENRGLPGSTHQLVPPIFVATRRHSKPSMTNTVALSRWRRRCARMSLPASTTAAPAPQV